MTSSKYFTRKSVTTPAISVGKSFPFSAPVVSGALKILGGLLVLLTVLLVIASIVGVRVPIHRLSGFLSPIVEGLGATARYAPGSYLEISLTPAISLEDLSIAGEHIALEVAHLSGAVELLPLFRRMIFSQPGMFGVS